MPNPIDKVKQFFELMRNRDQTIDEVRNKSVRVDDGDDIPVGSNDTAGTQSRLDYLAAKGFQFQHLTNHSVLKDTGQLHGNIEQFIGMTQVPTGIVGPLNIIGSEAHGDYFVPLATTEGALIASYDRGAKATRLSGGITSICLAEGVTRSPVFKFSNLGDLGLFVKWLLDKEEVFKSIVKNTSNHAQLIDFKLNIEGNHLIMTFEYLTGDASGQNMVTICTDAVCRYIFENNPIKPLFWFIESNYSGDKKATTLSFTSVRGKKVTAESEIEPSIVQSVLKTTPEAIAHYWVSSTCGVIQSGAIGAQGHVANGLCALFIATGQDVACVAEAAVGVTRMEVLDSGNLYVSVTLPNLIVGTIGGGTWLPTQLECLQLLGCDGQGKARKFAEICGALALAGELSIAAALSAGHFTSAHKKLGRKK